MACLASVQAYAVDESRKQEGPIGAFLGKPRMEAQPLFKAIRHPNVVVSLKGTVLATLGDKKLLARRSVDGGKTWGEEIIVAEPAFQGGGLTVDETTGDILAFAEDRHPVFGELVLHDIACIKMDLHVVRLETIHELNHFLGAVQVTIGKDVFNIKRDIRFLGCWQQGRDRLTCPPVTNVIRNRLRIFEPRNVDRSSNGKQIICPQEVGCLNHLQRQFHSLLAALGIIISQ